MIEFVGLIKSIKLKEKGSKASVVAKARKAIASIRQSDDENGALYVVRAMKLMESEASVTNNVTPIDMVIEHLKDG